MPLFGSTPFFVSQRISYVTLPDGSATFPETRISAPSGSIALQGYVRWVSGPAIAYGPGLVQAGHFDYLRGTVRDWYFDEISGGPNPDFIGQTSTVDLFVLCTQATNIPADQSPE